MKRGALAATVARLTQPPRRKEGLVDLHLAPDEVSLLSRVLTSYLSDLRAEIVKTENYEFRQGLKDDEASIKSLLSRLGEPEAGGERRAG
jgi:hypothetical protein